MKEALTEFFINSQMPYWQAFIWVFIGTLFGFVVGILDDKSAKDARKKARTRRKAKKYEIERLAERACNEMNDSSRLYSKAFNVLWGTYSNVRVFINAKVKVKKDTAIVHFWLAASDGTKTRWAPELDYIVDNDLFEDVLYLSSSIKDDFIYDMKKHYCEKLRRYL